MEGMGMWNRWRWGVEVGGNMKGEGGDWGSGLLGRVVGTREKYVRSREVEVWSPQGRYRPCYPTLATS